jgi:nicotinamide mononucleotide (NMN) deamidase PncC
MNLPALISQIHASPVMAVIVVTGGGAQAVADLLAVPGASKTVLEALVPYSERSLTEFLGHSPTQAVSIETAAAMAQAAYQRAMFLREAESVPVIGLSCTATLATDRPKKGEHRAHIGLCSANGTRAFSFTLRKGARNRHEEERVVSNVLISILAETCGVTEPANEELLPGEEILVHQAS